MPASSKQPGAWLQLAGLLVEVGGLARVARRALAALVRAGQRHAVGRVPLVAALLRDLDVERARGRRRGLLGPAAAAAHSATMERDAVDSRMIPPVDVAVSLGRRPRRVNSRPARAVTAAVRHWPMTSRSRPCSPSLSWPRPAPRPRRTAPGSTSAWPGPPWSSRSPPPSSRRRCSPRPASRTSRALFEKALAAGVVVGRPS